MLFRKIMGWVTPMSFLLNRASGNLIEQSRSVFLCVILCGRGSEPGALGDKKKDLSIKSGFVGFVCLFALSRKSLQKPKVPQHSGSGLRDILSVYVRVLSKVLFWMLKSCFWELSVFGWSSRDLRGNKDHWASLGSLTVDREVLLAFRTAEVAWDSSLFFRKIV